MVSEDAAGENPELGTDVLAQGPVDRDVAADGFDQLPGDFGLVTEYAVHATRATSSAAAWPHGLEITGPRHLQYLLVVVIPAGQTICVVALIVKHL